MFKLVCNSGSIIAPSCSNSNKCKCYFTCYDMPLPSSAAIVNVVCECVLKYYKHSGSVLSFLFVIFVFVIIIRVISHSAWLIYYVVVM